MNSNGTYAVEKIGCTILALAKTIVFSAYPGYSFTVCMPTYLRTTKVPLVNKV